MRGRPRLRAFVAVGVLPACLAAGPVARKKEDPIWTKPAWAFVEAGWPVYIF